MSEDKKEKSRFQRGLLGIDPTLGIGDKLIDYIEEAKEEEKKKLEQSNYYAFCPNCGKKLIRKNLIENGCFACGWKGTKEDLELFQTKSQNKSLSSNPKEVKNVGYKTNCPNCGAPVVTEEFLKNGCWRCGYK